MLAGWPDWAIICQLGNFWKVIDIFLNIQTSRRDCNVLGYFGLNYFAFLPNKQFQKHNSIVDILIIGEILAIIWSPCLQGANAQAYFTEALNIKHFTVVRIMYCKIVTSQCLMLSVTSPKSNILRQGWRIPEFSHLQDPTLRGKYICWKYLLGSNAQAYFTKGLYFKSFTA